MRSLLLLAAVLVGCVRPPQVLQGEFPPTSVTDAQAASHEGERVRWGGTIVATTLNADRSCLEIVSHRLDRRARPRLEDDTAGRFITCVEGFLDPEVYVAKREVTVVGVLQAATRGKVGEYDYVYPRVAADAIHLWRERPVEREPNIYYGVGGYWGPWWNESAFRYPSGGGFHHQHHDHHDDGPRPRPPSPRPRH